jgi:thiamine-monophosphate kinase
VRDDADVRLSDVGEDAVVEAIRRIVPGPPSGVVVGIGDDAAVLPLAPDRHLVFTVDALVEGVHFRRGWAAPADVGYKALAAAVSDVAAMGGVPRHAVVSLVAPPDTAVRWVEELYRGLAAAAEEFAVGVVGGNVARTDGPVVVDVAVVGEVEPDLCLRRDGARPGDLVVVTGTLGRSRGGLEVLRRGVRDPRGEPLVRAYLRPAPRLAEARAVALSGWATAMMDISDGLSTDVARMCAASGAGVRLDASAVPVDPAVRALADRIGGDAVALALDGGEDYELLVAVPPDHARALVERVHSLTGTAATVVGVFTPPHQGRTVLRDGAVRPLQDGGWDHFRRGADR